MVASPAGTKGRGTRNRHERERQHDAANAKKSVFKPRLKQQLGHPTRGQRGVPGGDGKYPGGLYEAADPGWLLVCLYETSKQLILETACSADEAWQTATHR
jgi:hypothetical protein